MANNLFLATFNAYSPGLVTLYQLLLSWISTSSRVSRGTNHIHEEKGIPILDEAILSSGITGIRVLTKSAKLYNGEERCLCSRRITRSKKINRRCQTFVDSLSSREQMTKNEMSPEKRWVVFRFVSATHTDRKQFYNAVLFMGSIAVFSLIAQRLNAGK